MLAEAAIIWDVALGFFRGFFEVCTIWPLDEWSEFAGVHIPGADYRVFTGIGIGYFKNCKWTTKYLQGLLLLLILFQILPIARFAAKKKKKSLEQYKLVSFLKILTDIMIVNHRSLGYSTGDLSNLIPVTLSHSFQFKIQMLMEKDTICVSFMGLNRCCEGLILLQTPKSSLVFFNFWFWRVAEAVSHSAHVLLWKCQTAC